MTYTNSNHTDLSVMAPEWSSATWPGEEYRGPESVKQMLHYVSTIQPLRQGQKP